jgi:hypothetical protein
MWYVIKDAVTQLNDAVGIEIPGLPIEVGSVDTTSITEAVTTATEGVTASATTAVEDLTATAGDAVAAAGTQASETVSGITGAAR